MSLFWEGGTARALWVGMTTQANLSIRTPLLSLETYCPTIPTTYLWADVPEDSCLGTEEQRDLSLADLIDEYHVTTGAVWS